VRLPIHVIKDINVCMRTAHELHKANDRRPRAAEIATSMQVDTAHVEKLLQLHDRVTIAASGGDETRDVLDLLPGHREAEPAVRTQRDKVSEIVDQWVGELGDKQRAVVERRFGLHGYHRATLEQIGRDIGVTRERVRQIQLDALANLRKKMESQGVSRDSLFD
jgi:RNA polymerase nonessential primary-like sigma factor